ncbi:hypothetical protein R1flu_016384 [Riccia fluitans]|uniref:Uncharacterized protein n=1 Tax=Riccia fluitans TaxID=41844 RepID=A0ABD1YLP6_9MARC
MEKLFAGSRSAAVACSSRLKLDVEPNFEDRATDRNVLDFDYFWHVMNVAAAMLLSLSSTSLSAAFPPHTSASRR